MRAQPLAKLFIGTCTLDTSDKDLYQAAAEELARGSADPGLLAKAFAESGGNSAGTEALYLKLRVKELKHLSAAREMVAISEARRNAADKKANEERIKAKAEEAEWAKKTFVGKAWALFLGVWGFLFLADNAIQAIRWILGYGWSRLW